MFKDNIWIFQYFNFTLQPEKNNNYNFSLIWK